MNSTSGGGGSVVQCSTAWDEILVGLTVTFWIRKIGESADTFSNISSPEKSVEKNRDRSDIRKVLKSFPRDFYPQRIKTWYRSSMAMVRYGMHTQRHHPGRWGATTAPPRILAYT